MELVTTSALLLILLGVVYSALTLSLTYYRQADDSVYLQQQAMAAAKRIVEEMGSSPSSSVVLSPDGVLFLSARTGSGGLQYNSSGAILWQRYVAYYTQMSGSEPVLVRKEKPLSAPSATVPSSPPSLASIQADASLKSTVVARSIQALSFTGGTPVAIRVTAGNDSFGGNTVTVTSGVSFRQ
ncbi:MAG TPA: hypothetical protein VNO81_00470 [Candidatus Nitrosotenuis sp.]|jgi:hypothetical protein|nr:hypothetical protein [Candidatus Nitrosotenuis sp.]